MQIKVLIVDDTRTIRFQIRRLLSGQDYMVAEAADGIDALEKIRTDKPHIVLMDVMMPCMDGIECCRRIKSDPENRDIKVVMVTTQGEYPRIKEAFQARCDDYITKPIQTAVFSNKLEELSKMVHTRMRLRTISSPQSLKKAPSPF